MGIAAQPDLLAKRAVLGRRAGGPFPLGPIPLLDGPGPRDYARRQAQWQQAAAGQWDAFGERELREARTVDGWEQIGPDTACAETMFLGLRLLDGLDLSRASAVAGQDLAARYRPEIEGLLADGLLLREGGGIRLAPSAYLVANQVFTRFLE